MRKYHAGFGKEPSCSRAGHGGLVHSYMLPADRSGKSVYTFGERAQISNSEDTLKILVPTLNGNVMSG